MWKLINLKMEISKFSNSLSPFSIARTLSTAIYPDSDSYYKSNARTAVGEGVAKVQGEVVLPPGGDHC